MPDTLFFAPWRRRLSGANMYLNLETKGLSWFSSTVFFYLSAETACPNINADNMYLNPKHGGINLFFIFIFYFPVSFSMPSIRSYDKTLIKFIFSMLKVTVPSKTARTSSKSCTAAITELNALSTRSRL